MAVGVTPIIAFGVFELDLRTGELRKNGIKIRLQEQPFRILEMLLERPGEMVGRDELQKKLWPGGVHLDVDHSINKAVGKLREALSDSADNPRFVETIPRRGYRFIAPVKSVIALAHTAAGDDLAPAATIPAAAPAEPRRGNAWLWPVAPLGLAIVVGALVLFGLSRTVSRRTPDPAGPAMTTVPLTSSPGRERYGALSPDGKQVAYAWTGEAGEEFDLFVKPIEASRPLRLTFHAGEEFSPAWSPDNRQVAFYRQSLERHGIFLIPAAGGPERPVERQVGWSRAAGSGFGMAWSPDGRSLAIVDRLSPQAANSIFLLSLDTGEKRRLTVPPGSSQSDMFPAFSPSGEKLAFTRTSRQASDVFVVPVDDGEPKQLAAPKQLTVNDTAFAGLAWSADGRSLIYSSRRAGGVSLWRVSAEGGPVERVSVGGDNAHFPSISRLGNRLVFTEIFLNTNIWRAEARVSESGTRPASRLIFSTRREDSPHYSPDGKRIVFASDRSGFTEIWSCDSEGRNPAQLTNFRGPLAGSPRWSPDGRLITFDARAHGQPDIYVMPAEGGHPTRLTTEGGEDVVPSWSRDGRAIYFASDRGGSLQIWKMPAAGGPAAPITKMGGFEAFESPDGKFLYYTRQRDVAGIYRAPVNGGEETPVPELAAAGFRRHWTVGGGGIYFLPQDAAQPRTIRFLPFAGGRAAPVAAIEKALVGGPPAMAVSPDGRWLLYTQVDRRDADLALVENFR